MESHKIFQPVNLTKYSLLNCAKSYLYLLTFQTNESRGVHIWRTFGKTNH